jgi:hypothetical protein
MRIVIKTINYETLLFTLFFTLLNLGANCQNTYVDSIFVMIDFYKQRSIPI